ncbi:alpha/beta hydrolase family esterase [Pseudochelatococcus lubricantis]|uniref:extracellular catalytic domain type 1 short-chain-length polyhydroxyalkanoate depolymerase n=1 Tax=Pseudochelatococcus lubricantis TaxID=1538102 RepID=UPI0035EC8981
MTGIASTTANLALWRMQWDTLFSLPHLLDDGEVGSDEGCRISEVEHFGDNPGNLRMFQYVPHDLPPGAPLVVVLHGCTQTAAGYDRGSGWSYLAEREGFAVLFAQQRNENNPRRCFNWFRVSDIERDAGEAASVRQMVTFMTKAHQIDLQRIFVTGLSAGGGMTNVMLSAYPEVFAAGAVVAGLPYRSATTVHEALQVMMEGSSRTPEERGDDVRRASPIGDLTESRIAVEWPRIAVWQGLADDVVRPSNAMEIVKQWANVHGLDELASDEDEIKGNRRLRWRGAEGQILIEAVAIEHLGHAVPIDAGRTDIHEQPGPHFADIGLSATEEIARFFGLLEEPAHVVADGGKRQVAGHPAAASAALPASRSRRGKGARVLRLREGGAAGRRHEAEQAAGEPAVAAPPEEAAPTALPPPEPPAAAVALPVALAVPLPTAQASAGGQKDEAPQRPETAEPSADSGDVRPEAPDRNAGKSLFLRVLGALGLSGDK